MSVSGRNCTDENENEMELLRIENKDLTEKLETLKLKRKEEHPKLAEFDKNLAELKALREVKTKLIESNTRLQRNLQEKDRELNELTKANQERHEWLSEIEERLEIVTVEKEMAEEKVELLQAEVETEKQRVEELEIELELLRSEAEQTGDGISQSDGLQMKQLETQNEKLREAVVRLRDVTGQLVEDKREFAQENEKLRDESAALVKLCENLKKELRNAELTIAALKEQIEASVDSEKIIEALTQKNMDLEKKLSALEETVEDYEAIRTLDEEILETQKEAERELKNEFDRANGRISDLLQQVKIYGEQVDDYEKTIMKFRRRIAELNAEIQEQHDDIINLNEQLKGGEDGSDAKSLHSTRLTTATRTFAEFVDAEVCSLELKYEIEFSNYLKAFLPDNFSKNGGDGDAILLNVRCSRLADKSSLLSKLLNHKYPLTSGGMRREHVTKSHKGEQWAHCAKFNFLLSIFGGAVRKFGSAVRFCSVERLSRLAHLQNDIAREERMIDQHIDLLRGDKFDENTPTDSIEKGIAFFQKKSLEMNTVGECMIRNRPIIDGGRTNQFTELVLTWVEKCEQFAVRLKNRIPADQGLAITQEVENELACLITTLGKAASILGSVCSIASIQLSTLTDAEGLEENRIQEALLYSVEKIHGSINGTEAEQILNEYLTSVERIVVGLVDKLDREELNCEPVKKSVSPLFERANARKQDVVEAEKLRWQLEKKETEITELKMNLRAKLDDISNYKLRLELADKKMESVSKTDENEVQKLHSHNEELQNQLRKVKMEYEETLETLQRDFEICEKENAELRKRARSISKKVLLANMTNAMIHSRSQPLISPTTPTDPTSPFSTSEQFTEVEFLEAELKEKRRSLHWAYQRIRQFKRFQSSEQMKLLSDMDAVDIPADICGPRTLLSRESSEKEELDGLCRRAENILMDARFYQVPYVVDTSKPKCKQMLEKEQHQKNVALINQRIADLKIDIHRFWNKYRRGEQLPSLFTNIDSIISSRPKKADGIVEEHSSKGVHSAAYKHAFQSLFGNLDEERKKIGSQQIAVSA